MKTLTYIVFLILVASPSSFAETLLAEDFESYTTNSSVIGQHDWVSEYGSTARIRAGTFLSSKVLDGRAFAGLQQETKIRHLLSRSLNSSEVTVLSFEAYATSTSPPSHNNVVYLGSSTNSERYQWFYNGASHTWGFAANGSTVSFTGGTNLAVHLSIVVDGHAGEVYGRFDIGGGSQETPRYSITPSEIAQIDRTSVYLDFRWPQSTLGIEIDQLKVVASETLFSEGFESYATNSSAIGQNGWVGEYGSTARIRTGTFLSSKVLDGRAYMGLQEETKLRHLLSRSLDASEITVLSFQAYATSTSPPSHNNVVYLGSSTKSELYQWFYNGASHTWGFAANGSAVSFTGGTNLSMHLSIIVDGPAGEVYGRFDNGTAIQETPHHSIAVSEIAQIDRASVYLDFRWPQSTLGIEIDDITVVADPDSF